jgi:imidazolonepropionase-like amidohydrolase
VAERFRRNNTWLVPTLIADQVVAQKKGVTKTDNAQAIVTRFTMRVGEFWSGTHLAGNWLRDSTNSAPSQTSNASSLGVLSVMQQAGLPILAGTDASDDFMQTVPPGFALHAEMAVEVAEGLTPLNALQSATIDPARMWHATDSLGTVSPGKLADLVLLDANPLEDITNTTTIRAVVANGRYFDRTALDGLLAKVQAKDKAEP